MGHQRHQVVRRQRLAQRLPHPDGRHRPRRGPVRAHVDDHRPDRHPGHRDAALLIDERPQPRRPLYVQAEVTYTDVRVPAENLLGDEGGPSRSPRSGSAPAASTTACAGSASAGGRSTALRACRLQDRARRPAQRQADGPELDRRLRRRDRGLPAAHAAGRVEDRPRGLQHARGDRDDQVPRRRVMHDVLDRRSRSTARSATPPTCRWRRCTAGHGPPASTTAPTRSTRSRSPAAAEGVRAGRRSDRAHPDPHRGGDDDVRREAGGPARRDRSCSRRGKRRGLGQPGHRRPPRRVHRDARPPRRRQLQ